MASSLARVCLSSSRSVLRRAVIQQTNKRGYAEEAAVAQAGQMSFTFASPAEIFYEASGAVKQVDIPTGTGAIGILANHVPTLGVLAPGVLSVQGNDGATSKFFVSSGAYTVNEDASVIVTAEEACRVEDLDKEVAKANLVAAQSALSAATTEAGKMEAQISIACIEAIINA